MLNKVWLIRVWSMNNLPAVMAASADYEPLPRSRHISERVGSLVVVQGGETKDFSEESKQHLNSVVEIFDPYSESWEQRQVEGNAPSPGTHFAASASLHDDLFSFGGRDGSQRFDTVHRLDTNTAFTRAPFFGTARHGTVNPRQAHCSYARRRTAL